MHRHINFFLSINWITGLMLKLFSLVVEQQNLLRIGRSQCPAHLQNIIYCIQKSIQNSPLKENMGRLLKLQSSFDQKLFNRLNLKEMLYRRYHGSYCQSSIIPELKFLVFPPFLHLSTLLGS